MKKDKLIEIEDSLVKLRINGIVFYII